MSHNVPPTVVIVVENRMHQSIRKMTEYCGHWVTEVISSGPDPLIFLIVVIVLCYRRGCSRLPSTLFIQKCEKNWCPPNIILRGSIAKWSCKTSNTVTKSECSVEPSRVGACNPPRHRWYRTRAQTCKGMKIFITLWHQCWLSSARSMTFRSGA